MLVLTSRACFCPKLPPLLCALVGEGNEIRVLTQDSKLYKQISSSLGISRLLLDKKILAGENIVSFYMFF